MNDVLKYFPDKLQVLINNETKEKKDELEEIHVRVSKPILLKYSNNEKAIKYYVSPEEILTILQLVCENSIYTYQNQIAEGFVTIQGGHRVGVTGSCVIQNGKVININYINSLNFRISRQVIGSGQKALKHILDENNNSIFSTLIVAPPRLWKNHCFKRYCKTNFEWN